MARERVIQRVRVGNLLAVIVPAVSAGCGVGTALAGAGVAEIGGGSGGDNAASVASDLDIEEDGEMGRAVLSPATIQFRLTDQDGDDAQVTLLYAEEDAPVDADFRAMTLVGRENPFRAVPREKLHEVLWDFEADLGEGYSSGITLRLLVKDGVGAEDRTGVEVGNTPPTIVSAKAPSDPESTGVVLVEFELADSASDLVILTVQFAVDEEGDSEHWELATPAGSLEDELPTTPDGLLRTFAWDSAEDVPGSEEDVRLRFVARDKRSPSVEKETDPFRVDNDSPPRALYDNSLLVNNADETRGIPIPFRLSDEGENPTRVIVQWKRPGAGFPALPTEMEELEAVLADAGKRRANRICTELPRVFRGRARPHPSDPRKAVLPELAGAAAGLRAEGLAGRSLEILRSNGITERLGARWEAPVAALPIDNGPTALVLHALGDSWGLSEVDLARGTRGDFVATSAGVPSAMAFAPDRRSVLVASTLGETWQVQRVELQADGAVLPLVDARDGATEVGRVRGIASLGQEAALITVGTSLIRLDFGDEARASTLLEGLETPWGVAPDPLNANHVYLAESAAPRACGGVGRVLRVALDTYRTEEVFTDPEVCEGLERPTAIALERSGARLLAVTDANPADGKRELRGVDIGGRDRGVVFELVDDLAQDTSSLAVARDDLRVLALPSEGDLAVGGGVLQRRTLVAPDGEPDPGGITVRVADPFEPPLEPNAPWRVAAELRTRSSETGVNNVFVWDSGDVPEGEVLVRITPLDTDVGIAGEGLVSKRIRTFEAPVQVGREANNRKVVGVVAADLNGDGWLDLASTNPLLATVTVFYQAEPTGFPGAPGTFFYEPDEVLGSEQLPSPHGLVAADLNGDGLLDLAVADEGGDERLGKVGVYYRTTEGVFAESPVVLNGEGSPEIVAPVDLEAADLDRNGLVDLVVGSTESGEAVVFFQKEVGEFVVREVAEDPKPLRLNRLAVADLNGDGRLDLVLANTDEPLERCQGHLRVFLQVPPEEPGEGWEPPRFAPTEDLLGALDTATTEVLAADLNGDGRLDLAALRATDVEGESGAGERTVQVYHQLPDAPGRFPTEPSHVLGDPASVESPVTLVASDLDGDGRLDLVSANQESDNLTAFLQARPEGFGSSPDFELGASDETQGARFVAAADLNGDGRPDLASANFEQGDLTVFRQKAPGEFSSEPDLVLGTSVSTDAPIGLDAADLDGDGLVDLVSANRKGEDLAVFPQEAPGRFPRVPTVSLVQDPATPPLAVRAADLDGDERVDLVSANEGTNDVTIFYGSKSAGAFREPVRVDLPPGQEGPTALAVSDLSGDGLLDIAVSVRSPDGALVVIVQSALSGFAPPSEARTVLEGEAMKAPLAVVAADLNGDGRVDLASANRVSDNVTLFYQPEDGFGAERGPDVLLGEPPSMSGEPMAVGDVPGSIVAEDLNGDGRLDLALAYRDRGAVGLFFQPRTGFQSRAVPRRDVLLRNLGHPRALVVADLDGDGLSDVASANRDDGEVTVFFQTSPGRFPEDPDEVLFAARPVALVAADLNADGELDLASAANRHVRGDDRIAVFFGGK